MQHDAILVTEDRDIVLLNLPATPENFAEYAAAVLRCSDIEAFDLTTGVVLWLDEDGRDRWGYNAIVDNLVNRYGHTNSLHGPVLITGYGSHVNPLTPWDADRILRELSDITG
ncbi:hypothetical protein OIE75_20395 [Streptomyces sp. NBC_01723]|uniref:DUF3846 domain-containing protein n=1 Tax=Streptomyces sp. NBC_01723 TaxID=2975921 RepID=UPI002E318137|nr:hypothetical protein [Streptomyces sp. NBC_01723]